MVIAGEHLADVAWESLGPDDPRRCRQRRSKHALMQGRKIEWVECTTVELLFSPGDVAEKRAECLAENRSRVLRAARVSEPGAHGGISLHRDRVKLWESIEVGRDRRCRLVVFSLEWCVRNDGGQPARQLQRRLELFGLPEIGAFRTRHPERVERDPSVAAIVIEIEAAAGLCCEWRRGF